MKDDDNNKNRNSKLSFLSFCNVFHSNVLENGNGGAISALGNSYVGIELSTFSGNSAFNGGAIYNMGYTDVNNTHFHGNSAIIGGGALYSGASSNTKLRQSDFVKNKAGYYGEVSWRNDKAEALVFAVAISFLTLT